METFTFQKSRWSLFLWSVLFVCCFTFSTQPSAAQARTTTSEFQLVEPVPIKVLIFNYCVYDAFYARSIRSILEQNRTDLEVSEFWYGDADALSKALNSRDAVIVPYAAEVKTRPLNKHAEVLQDFVEAGGTVIFTGTHEYHALKLFDMMEVQGAAYQETPSFKVVAENDRLAVALPDTFSSKNFAYPISVHSAEFVPVVEASGAQSVGYLERGKGKVIYAGIEFYYDEPATTRVLLNALEAGFELKSDLANEKKEAEQRALDLLKPESVGFDWKIYPNPYTQTAYAELNLEKTETVTLELVSETGALVSTMLNKQQLAAGSYTYTMPEMPDGIYFVRYTCGQEIIVKKVVKMFVP